MMLYRFLALFFLSFLIVLSADEIDRKIKKTSTKLSSYSKNYSLLNRKMAETAKEILRQKRELLLQESYLEKLKEELLGKEKSYERNIKDLKILKKSQKELKERQNRVEEDLVFVIAQSVSLLVVLDEEYPANEEALIELEVLKAMLEKSKAKVKKLSSLYFSNVKIINDLDKKSSFLEKSIAVIDSKRKELLRKQAQKKRALKKLQIAKASYKKALKRLIKRQNALKKTLSRLHLIKIDKIRRAKEEEERKKAFSRKSIVLNEKLPKVKKHGSSYQSVPTISYRGVKTIAPLRGYSIVKKYGTYKDPIYGIKIFNESISLKPKKQNAKVRNVFNGKVIYADKTAVLKNIVIVEHKNGLHTIYANLSQIAPGVKKGKKIKRGGVLGRIKDELVFEVTQKSAHINPVELFK